MGYIVPTVFIWECEKKKKNLGLNPIRESICLLIHTKEN